MRSFVSLARTLCLCTFLSACCAVASSTFTGTVQANSAPVDEANITLWDSANGTNLKTSSSAGIFAINGIAAGDYFFEVEKTGYRSVYGAVHLSGDGPHEVTISMREISGASLDSVAAAAPLRNPHRPPRATAIPPVVKPAQVKSKLSPIYPDAERKSGIRGSVRIAMIILPNGALDDLVVLSAPDGGLARAALAAVRQWKYSPTYLDGQAVEANLTVDVNFR